MRSRAGACASAARAYCTGQGVGTFGDVATAFIVERAEPAVGRNSWEIIATRLKTKFSNNIRNNFGFLNRTAPVLPVIRYIRSCVPIRLHCGGSNI